MQKSKRERKAKRRLRHRLESQERRAEEDARVCTVRKSVQALDHGVASPYPPPNFEEFSRMEEASRRQKASQTRDAFDVLAPFAKKALHHGFFPVVGNDGVRYRVYRVSVPKGTPRLMGWKVIRSWVDSQSGEEYMTLEAGPWPVLKPEPLRTPSKDTEFQVTLASRGDVRHVRWSPSIGLMEVELKRGGCHRYVGLSGDVYDGLVNAEDPDAYMRETLKKYETFRIF